MQRVSHSIQETLEIAKEVVTSLHGGDILLLQGDLGAGKTTFTKGLLSYFDIAADDVVSPTFTLLQEYTLTPQTQNISTIAHIDTYRLEHEADLIEIGVEDYLDDTHTLTIIEWPEKLNTLLEQKQTTLVEIKHLSKDSRTIVITKNS